MVKSTIVQKNNQVNYVWKLQCNNKTMLSTFCVCDSQEMLDELKSSLTYLYLAIILYS